MHFDRFPAPEVQRVQLQDAKISSRYWIVILRSVNAARGRSECGDSSVFGHQFDAGTAGGRPGAPDDPRGEGHPNAEQFRGSSAAQYSGIPVVE